MEMKAVVAEPETVYLLRVFPASQCRSQWFCSRRGEATSEFARLGVCLRYHEADLDLWTLAFPADGAWIERQGGLPRSLGSYESKCIVSPSQKLWH